jgi:hypothetical protein
MQSLSAVIATRLVIDDVIAHAISGRSARTSQAVNGCLEPDWIIRREASHEMGAEGWKRAWARLGESVFQTAQAMRGRPMRDRWAVGRAAFAAATPARPGAYARAVRWADAFYAAH